MFHVPAPFLMKPDVLLFETAWPVQVKVAPVPISKVRTELLVLSVPAAVTVTVTPSSTFTSPIDVVAKVTVELAVNSVFLSAVHAIVNGPLEVLPQLALVQVAETPLVFQKRSVAATCTMTTVRIVRAIKDDAKRKPLLLIVRNLLRDKRALGVFMCLLQMETGCEGASDFRASELSEKPVLFINSPGARPA
jgi:hypothetical protein